MNVGEQVRLKGPIGSAMRKARALQLGITDSREAVLRDLDADTDAAAQRPASVARSSDPVHIVITSTGRSNIGDQAMFESVIANTPGKVTAITGPRANLVVPPGDVDRVTLRPMPALVYGAGARHRRAARQFLELVEHAASCSVIGADLMDGGYQRRTAAVPWRLLSVAAAHGVASAVYGFSWKHHADPVVIGEARRAVRAGVRAMIRDPESARRFAGDTGEAPTEVADVVFAGGFDPAQSDAREVLRGWRERGRRVLLLNTSALIHRHVDVIDDYVEIIRQSRKVGFEVLVVPHVGGADGGDFRVAQLVADRAVASGLLPVQHVGVLLSPSQIKGLATEADAVVTGRMHLSILSMSAGTPALVISTHGKVDGLLELFDSPQFVIPMEQGLGRIVCDQLMGELATPGEAAARISDRLPRVVAMSRRNFEHLG